MTGRQIHEIRRKLLAWYARARRDLPWRQSRDPYAIWIAETMLQQTQVNTVLPDYPRFMQTFPTLRSLYRARRDKVLALWSGLGYYRRVENLKKTTHQIIREHRGKLPRDYAVLLQLPGVGPYTAGTLMSIAFHQPYPALDGNATRVIQRLFDLDTDKTVRAAGKKLVSPHRPGQFNQALMELGSKICNPRKPSCTLCPLASVCLSGATGRIRNTTGTRRSKNIVWPMALIRENERILLRRRTGRGILEGLWEVPGRVKMRGETLESIPTRHLKGSGYRVRVEARIDEIRHSITNHRIRAPLFHASKGINFRPPELCCRWIPIPRLHRYPLSSLSLRAIRKLD